MTRAVRALVSICCAAILVAAAVSPCEGWEATPQERHDCCERQQCKHLEEPAGWTQADADECCLRAERGTPDRTEQVRISNVIAVVSIDEIIPASPALDVALAFSRRAHPPGRAPALLLKSVLQV